MTASVARKQYTMNIGITENNILRTLNEQRKRNGHSNCEVILMTNGIEHFAHKIVLVSCSDFFRKYFENTSTSSESTSEKGDVKTRKLCDKGQQNQTTVSLPGISRDELAHILEYMYTSKLALNAENVNEILLVGCLLQITSVIEFCAEVLLKQPNWRSPLVSPKLVNFVKIKNSGTSKPKRLENRAEFSEAFTNLPTAVQWATNSARMTSFDMKVPETRQYVGQQHSSNTIANNKNILTVRVKQGRRHKRDVNDRSGDGHVAKKRRHPNDFSNKTFIEINEIKKIGQEYVSGNDTYSSDSTTEIAIDSEELSKELIQSYKLKNSIKTAYTPTFIQRPFIATKTIDKLAQPERPRHPVSTKHAGMRLSPRVESNQIYGSPCDNLAGYPNQSTLSDNDFLRKDRNNYSMPLSSQVRYCNPSLAAAYASRLGIPMFHPEYFGFPIINPFVNQDLRQTLMEAAAITSTSQKMDNIYVPNSTEQSRPTEKTNPISRYSGSVTAIYAPPGHLEEYNISQTSSKRPRSNQGCTFQTCSSDRNCSQTKTARLMRQVPSDMEAACAQTLLDLTYKPRVKHFCPSIVHQQSVVNKTCNGANMNAKNVSRVEINNFENRKLSLSNNIQFHNASDIKSCRESGSHVVQKTTTCDASSTTNNKVDIESNMKTLQPDYHRRKRKLLLAAQSLDDDQNNDMNSKCNVSNNGEIFHPTDKSGQYSSEDDIIARECHQQEVVYPESDDSGRPSSV